MANQEQLAILQQGVHVWNKWREVNIEFGIDLRGADLHGTNLSGANLQQANLQQANFVRADLQEANLQRAFMGFARLRGANLARANLQRADLQEANLFGTNLSGANLQQANLQQANLQVADLRGAYLQGALLGATKLADVDLAQIIGLEMVHHDFPSTIGTDALRRSQGKIPNTFLRGCGLSDWEIESAKLYNPDLSNEERNKVLYSIYDFQASQAIQVSHLFISYSHANSDFVDKLGQCLEQKGVRYWRDIHEMKAGRIETQIDRGIRQNPTVLLVLSEQSLTSDWVQHEVRAARDLEKEMGRDVLCPVALDDSWKDSRWPKRLMEQIMEYNILDFAAWQDDSKFDGMFRKLIDGLELFYKR